MRQHDYVCDILRVTAVLDKTQYLNRWQQLHGGFDYETSRLVRPWLTFMYAISAPVARQRIRPNAVTAAGVATALVALVAASLGGAWLFVAPLLVVISSLLDGVDGAVAVISRRDDAWGFVVDTVADRCSDLLFLAAIAAVGAPWQLIAAMMIATMLHESVRARSAAAGMSDTGVITVWERPSRVVTSVLIVGTAAVFPTTADLTSLLGSIVGVVLAGSGLLHLLFVVRARTRGSVVHAPPLLVER